MSTIAIQNLKCGGCAHTIETSLEKRFGHKAVVDIEKGTVTIDVASERQAELLDALHGLGYPAVGEKMGVIDSAVTTAKSYVSCAIGRVT